MKKIILFILLIVIFTFVNAQESKFNLGIEAGPGISTLWGNGVQKGSSNLLLTYSGGLFFQYNNPSNKSSIFTNINYERKGYSVQGTETDEYGNITGISTGKCNLDYLSVPIQMRLTFGNKINFFVNGGPCFNYLFKQNFVVKSTHITKYTYSDISQYNRFELGIATGFGLGFVFSEKYLFLFEIRNNFGVYTISKATAINGLSIKNNSTNVLIGLAYKL